MREAIPMAKQMSKVQNCTVEDCSYNSDRKCCAMAITVGDQMEARCDTFVHLPKHVHSQGIDAGVGACKMEKCSFNEDLECSSPQIKIGKQGNNADCLTFNQA